MNQAISNISRTKYKKAYADVADGLSAWQIGLTLGWQDIRLRYRRSQLGPLWITLSTAIMIYSMGFLYSKLFKIDLVEYYPFIASGMIAWTFVSTMILEMTDAFVDASGFTRQIKLPFTIFVLRVLVRNFIVLLHNFIPVIPIIIYFHINFNLSQFIMLLIGILLLSLNSMSYGMILAILGTRYRDIKPIVVSMIQLVFLLTPIMWRVSMLPDKYKLLANLNPFYQAVELLRAPLTGHDLPLFNIEFMSILAIVGGIASFWLLAKTRHRIAFWS